MKRFGLSSLVVVVFFLLGALSYLLYTNKINIFFNLFQKPTKTKPVNIFGQSLPKNQYNFPSENPQFTAIIGGAKSPNAKQQTITIFRYGDKQKTSIFERGFYTDQFRGNDLTYTIGSGSATIIQKGTLGSLGCTESDCLLPWSNFYTWDAKQNTFILDNARHTDEFQELATEYKTIDTKGCAIVSGDIVTNQKDLSFTDIYKKYQDAHWYCSKTQGILPANLVLFLQAEQTIQSIIKGENQSSNDIRDVSL